jgi:hypothetical protein
MDICERYRIPHSHFLGGPLVWTQQDRDKAIWHARHRAERCSGCGTHPDEWDPKKGGDRQAYAAVESRCAGCAALELQQELTESRPKEDRLRGVRIVLRSRESIEREVAAGRAEGAGSLQR